MPLTERENFLRNASLAGHEWIPMSVDLSEATWYEHGEALEEVVLRHPTIWPGYEAGSRSFDPPPPRDEPRKWTDEWGCTWQYEIEGIEGQVVGHPLDEWDKLDSWQPPEPALRRKRAPIAVEISVATEPR